jgi:hypothetical protein
MYICTYIGENSLTSVILLVVHTYMSKLLNATIEDTKVCKVDYKYHKFHDYCP